MKAIVLLAAIAWLNLWFTPNQQGKRHFQRGEFEQAALAFEDPMWQGMALYRAGEFENAARAFARRDTPEAHFNRGNAWLLTGRYDVAISAYDLALEKRPDWREAIENRDIAIARAKLVESSGGDMGDQKIGADEVVFDNQKRDSGQDTEVNVEEAASDQNMQALWLRRVQTKPSDFLKAKFSYQRALQAEEGGVE